MNSLFAGIAGLLFGLGLIVAGMANPAKVLGFLDVAGAWDPSLAFVMGGGIGVAVVAFAMAKKRARSLLGLDMKWPTATRLDRGLIGGSLLFGVGWGLAGICPGPAIVLLGTGAPQGAIFVVAMLAGMAIYEWQVRRASRHLQAAPPI
jgi:uncharacterized membrane protein YedE/YeeE